MEAVVDRRVRSILGWAVAPARADPQHVHDARDHSSIIDPPRALAPLGQQRLDLRPLRITQPRQLSRHQSLLLSHKALNQRRRSRATLLSTEPSPALADRKASFEIAADLPDKTAHKGRVVGEFAWYLRHRLPLAVGLRYVGQEPGEILAVFVELSDFGTHEGHHAQLALLIERIGGAIFLLGDADPCIRIIPAADSATDQQHEIVIGEARFVAVSVEITAKVVELGRKHAASALFEAELDRATQIAKIVDRGR